MDELDQGLGDLHGIIVGNRTSHILQLNTLMKYTDMEVSIARQMADRILEECATPLMNVDERAAELDWCVP